jgi:hypothetical protein
MLILKQTFFALTLFAGQALWAQEALYMPGSIPLDDSRRPGTDIFYKGQRKTPDELVQLRKQGIDLSDLNPDENTEIWRNELGAPLSAKQDEITIDLASELQYVASIPSRTGNFRFTVKQTDLSGNTRIYRFWASKNAHSLLLRKNLLRKLGYRVPKIAFLPKVKIQFKGQITKKDFLKNLSNSTLGDSNRWALNANDENSLDLQMQDLIVFEDNEAFYNLANGYVSANDIIQGRRIMNSLIVPYSIVNVQETVNGMSWLPGRIFNQFVLLPVDYAEEFSTPKEDAVWILKRIAKLTRADFTEIVKLSYFPEDVEKLLIEKIISRRNWLVDKFKIAAGQISFDSKVTFGKTLINGELLPEQWPGHAARYAYSDPESPLSPAEIRAFFKAKGLATGIEALASKLDSVFFKGTDIEKKIIEKQIEAARKQFINFLKTGKVSKIPFGLFAFPTIDGEIWVSRDIVTGEYLGTDNMIQLADTLELSVTPGVFISAVGLPKGVQIAAGAQLNFGRSYTHLKNIKSIRKALKEPFKNMLVSMLKKENGRIFDVLLSESYQALEPAEKEIKFTEIMKTFNESMATGDSFIISNNVSNDTFTSFGYGFSENVSLQASLYASRFSVGRLHILKRDENTIQIYKDHGDALIKGVNIGLKAYIPVVTIEFSKTNGKASTKFYSLDLNPKFSENPEVESTALALRQILIENSFELLNAKTKPYLIEHQFDEKTSGASFLFLKTFGAKSTNRIQITHPEGDKRSFVRSTEGRRKGNDYQGVTVDSINALLDDKFEDEVSVPNPGSGDPGDTFKGHSSMRNAIMEVEIADNDGRKELAEPFLDIAYRWKGWKIKSKKMLELIDEVNEKFGLELFSKLDFQMADSFQLYSINVNLYFYPTAIESVSKISPDLLKKILLAEGNFPNMRIRQGETPLGHQARIKDTKERTIRAILKNQREFISLYHLGTEDESLKHGLKFISSLEMILPFQRLIQIVGGEQNIFVYGQATSFREGDENGDLPIVANSLGRFGEEKPRGGLYRIQSSMGATPMEFYIYWLLRNL